MHRWVQQAVLSGVCANPKNLPRPKETFCLRSTRNRRPRAGRPGAGCRCWCGRFAPWGCPQASGSTCPSSNGGGAMTKPVGWRVGSFSTRGVGSAWMTWTACEKALDGPRGSATEFRPRKQRASFCIRFTTRGSSPRPSSLSGARRRATAAGTDRLHPGGERAAARPGAGEPGADRRFLPGIEARYLSPARNRDGQSRDPAECLVLPIPKNLPPGSQTRRGHKKDREYLAFVLAPRQSNRC